MSNDTDFLVWDGDTGCAAASLDDALNIAGQMVRDSGVLPQIFRRMAGSLAVTVTLHEDPSATPTSTKTKTKTKTKTQPLKFNANTASETRQRTRILGYLASSDAGEKLAALAAGLHLSQSEVATLVAGLVAEGKVSQSGQGSAAVYRVVLT